ncbi:MAG: hypothetical protein ACRELX_15040, partial [Longimicrobiales bacterium]
MNANRAGSRGAGAKVARRRNGPQPGATPLARVPDPADHTRPMNTIRNGIRPVGSPADAQLRA